MKKWEIVYMAVSADKYSLPIAVFDTITEASAWEGCSNSQMHHKIHKHLFSIKNRCYFIAVKLKK